MPADTTLNVSITYEQRERRLPERSREYTSLTDQADGLWPLLRPARDISSQRPHHQPASLQQRLRLPERRAAHTHHLRLFRLESDLHPRQRRADYDRHRRPARPSAHQPRHERHAYALRPGRRLTWGNAVTDTRTFDLEYRMTSVKDVGKRQYPVSHLRLRRRQQRPQHHGPRDPGHKQTLTWDVINHLTRAPALTPPRARLQQLLQPQAFTGTSITHYADADRMKKWGSSASPRPRRAT